MHLKTKVCKLCLASRHLRKIVSIQVSHIKIIIVVEVFGSTKYSTIFIVEVASI